MPPKTTPAAKKVKKTAKASSTGRIAKVSTRASKVKSQMGESFLLPTIQHPSDRHTSASSPREIMHATNSSGQDQHNTLLAMLSDIAEGQKALAERVSVIETASRPTPEVHARESQHPTAISSRSHVSLPPNDHLLQPDMTGEAPTLDMLRSQPSANQAADEVIDQMDSSVRRRMMATTNPRKSGRFNSSDLPGADPMLRWPNEGTKVISGKRKIPYDDLSIPQWVYGQVTNILQVRFYPIQNYMLIQLVYAMKDAAHLPWHAVRDAYASSMHDIEEGTLQWSDTIQWSINRLGASRTAYPGSVQLVHRRARTPTASDSSNSSTRLCTHYIEGKCRRQGDHGIYRHPCLSCYRAGRPDSHPETDCQFAQASVHTERPRPRQR